MKSRYLGFRMWCSVGKNKCCKWFQKDTQGIIESTDWMASHITEMEILYTLSLCNCVSETLSQCCFTVSYLAIANE